MPSKEPGDSDSEEGESSYGGRDNRSMERKTNDDDEFGFDDEFDDSVRSGDDRSPPRGGGAPRERDTGAPKGSNSAGQKVLNKPYDEAVDLDSSEEMGESVDTDNALSRSKGGDSNTTSPMGKGRAGDGRGDSPPRGGHSDFDRNFTRDSEADRDIPSSKSSATGGRSGPGSVSNSIAGKGSNPSSAASGGRAQGSMKAVRDEKESSSEEEDDEDHAQSTSSAGNESSNRVGPAGYNPADYAHLNVSAEIKELFQYIGRYKPHQIELETRVKCFIPDYIPAVGEIDAFIKVPKPDGKPDDLGLVVVDEPAAEQSDPTVLELQMRAITKKHNLEPMVVRSIENAAHNTKDIQRWIDSIEELHKSKPPPQVHYSKNMPDIEGLMQIWPEDVEQVLGEVELPPSDIDASVAEYARVICAIMDIPVYEGSSPNAIVQSLHVLFTLYSEFNQNQHFTGGAVAGVVGKGAGIELGESKEIEDGFSKDISANNRFDMEESKLMHK